MSPLSKSQRALERSAELVTEARRVIGVEPGDDGELVAAETGDGRADRRAAHERAGHGDQQLVTDAVAERVVHLFELIEIEHRERDTWPVNRRIGEHLGELVVQGRAVRERRQWIAVGERFERPAGLHDLAHILGQNGDVVPRQRCDPDRYVQLDPVATLQIERFDERRALVAHGVGDDLDESGVVAVTPAAERIGSGVDEALPDRVGHDGGTERFDRRVLGPHDEGRRVGRNDELEDHDAERQRVDELHVLLGEPTRGHGIRDVSADPSGARHLTAVVLHDVDRVLDPAIRAAQRPDAIADRVSVARCRCLIRMFDDADVVRMDQSLPGAGLEVLLERPAEHPLDRPVDRRRVERPAR